MVSKIKRQQVALHILKVMGVDNFVAPDDVPMWDELYSFLSLESMAFIDAVRCIYDSYVFDMSELLDKCSPEEAQAILLGLTMLLPVPSATDVIEV